MNWKIKIKIYAKSLESRGIEPTFVKYEIRSVGERPFLYTWTTAVAILDIKACDGDTRLTESQMSHLAYFIIDVKDSEIIKERWRFQDIITEQEKVLYG